MGVATNACDATGGLSVGWVSCGAAAQAAAMNRSKTGGRGILKKLWMRETRPRFSFRITKPEELYTGSIGGWVCDSRRIPGEKRRLFCERGNIHREWVQRQLRHGGIIFQR